MPAAATARPRPLVTRLAGGVLTTSLVLLGLAVATGPADAAQPCVGTSDAGLTLTCGHVDAFAVTPTADGIALALKEDVTGRGVLHDPSDVRLQVGEEARRTLPSPVPSGLGFLGSPGDEFYLLPQTQDPGQVWPGWSTETLTRDQITSPVRIDVSAVDGPGRVLLWQTGAFGASSSVLESGGFELPGAISAAVPAHVHANWAFTEPGRYRLTVRASGTRPDGSTASTQAETYTFDVGQQATQPTPPPTPQPTQPPASSEPTTPAPGSRPGGVACASARAAWDVRNGTVNRCGATVLNDGHVDVASTLRRGTLVTSIKDTTTATERYRDPARTILQLLPRSRATVPSGSQWSFLGRRGASFYEVSQTQQAGLLWPGWSTEAIGTDETTGPIRWSLDDVDGPGEFAIYQTDSFGTPDVLFNTRASGRRTSIDIPKRSHVHGSWAFSSPGLYCMSMQRVAQAPSGRTLRDAFTLAVAVGRTDVMNVDPRRCGARVDADRTVAPPPRSTDATSGETRTTAPTRAPGQACKDPRPGSPTSATDTTVLSAGHVDYSSRIVDGRLQSFVGDDTTGSGSKIYRDPASTVLRLRSSSRTTLPAGYGQVGPAGRSVFQVPQTQRPGLIWLGWSTEQLDAGNIRGGVRWSLDRVEGPGSVKVYLTGSFGGVQTMVFSGPGSSYQIAPGVHAHANWAFEREGTYRLTTTQSAALADGRRSSDTETLTIVVGDGAVGAASAGTRGAEGCGDSDVEAPDQAKAAALTSPDSVAGDARADAVRRSLDLGPVPALLGALGGLLLVAAAGLGLLLVRRTDRP